MTSDFRLHHIGILVQNIERSSEHYVRAFGYEVRSPVMHDPQQMALVRFLALPDSNQFIELVAPDSATSHLNAALKRGIGIHHYCLVTGDIEADLAHSREHGALIISEPVPAVAFGGKRIAWIMNRDMVLMEFVEAPAEVSTSMR
jgi:methylmalonyl-CoA/ethylmalonyl-CoA epimerase